MRKLFYAIASIALALPAAQGAYVLSGTGSGLVGTDQSFTVGDKTFSNFTCSILGPFGTALPTDCSQIGVAPDVDTSGNNGIRFQTLANAISTSTLGVSAVDILITYTVTAPAPLITDIHMIFNGNVTGTGSTNVTETVVAPGVGTVGQITVQNPPPVLEAAVNVTGGPYTTLNVTKDMFLSAGPGGAGTANFSFVGQYFSQVPEPASVVFLGTTLLGATALLRKKFKRS